MHLVQGALCCLRLTQRDTEKIGRSGLLMTLPNVRDKMPMKTSRCMVTADTADYCGYHIMEVAKVQCEFENLGKVMVLQEKSSLLVCGKGNGIVIK